MKKTNDKYWNEREAEDLLLESEKTTETAIDKIQRLYEDTTKEINKSLEKTFKGYARRNEITEAEATEYLSNAQRLDHIEYLENELLIATEEEKKRLIPQYNAIATNYRLSRLETLKSDLVVKLNRLAMAEVFINADNYKKVAKNLDKKIITYTAKTLEVDGMSGINSNVIDEIVNARWYGKNYSERVWSNRDKLEQVLNEQIKQGIAKGTSIRDLSKDLSETMDVGMYPAVRLIRTETAFVHGQITLEEYKQMGVEEYRYIATLDKRTSKICRELDYKIYKVKDAKVGKNFPPMHPNCRSTTVPASEEIENRVAKDYDDKPYITEVKDYTDYVVENEGLLFEPSELNKLSLDDRLKRKGYLFDLKTKIKDGRLDLVKDIEYNKSGKEIRGGSNYIQKEEGFFDILAHGNMGEIVDRVIKKDTWLNAKDISIVLKESLGYIKGTPIRLLSCLSGSSTKKQKSLAQELANEMNVLVKGYDGVIQPQKNGNFTIEKPPLTYRVTKKYTLKEIEFIPEVNNDRRI